MRTAYIAIGSNVDARSNLERALHAFAESDVWQVLARSSLYRTPAVDQAGRPTSQGSYLNAVIALRTKLSACTIRRRLRHLEAAQGRDRRSPQQVTLDLDLIALDREILDVDGHHIPDPSIVKYAFVAAPFAEIAPDWVHPETGELLSEIAAKLHHQLELEIVPL